MVKECVHIDTGRYYAAKVINKRMMSGREHMVRRKALEDCRNPRLIRAMQVRNEIEVLKRVSMGHQNILTLVDFFETMNNRKLTPASSFLASVLLTRCRECTL